MEGERSNYVIIKIKLIVVDRKSKRLLAKTIFHRQNRRFYGKFSRKTKNRAEQINEQTFALTQTPVSRELDSLIEVFGK